MQLDGPVWVIGGVHILFSFLPRMLRTLAIAYGRKRSAVMLIFRGK